jgi:hypothetical protein
MTLFRIEGGEQFVRSSTVGDLHGLPVNTKTGEQPKGKTLWFLYISQDSDGRLITRQYLDASVGSIEALVKRAKASENAADDSNWVDKAVPNNLNNLQFKGSGTFVIVMGKPAWRFYDYVKEGHQPIVFKREKTYFRRDSTGNDQTVAATGDYNWSFVDGKAIKILDDFPGYVCNNLCKKSADEYLKEGESTKLLFDINIELPLGTSGEYVLVVVDPGGNNQGPH